jgi:hypothetical protein
MLECAKAGEVLTKVTEAADGICTGEMMLTDFTSGTLD